MTGDLTIPVAKDAARRAPAPGRLELVRQLINTTDAEDGTDDEISTPGGLRDWLAMRGLMGAGERVGESDVRLAVEMREALRSLCLFNNGHEPEPDALETLNSVARLSPVLVRFGEDGNGELAPTGAGVPGALGRLLGVVYGAMSEGTWERLKACPAERCMWAFYDHSRNRSKQWCRMEVCGNRAKARSYRERQRTGQPGAGG